MDHTSASSRYHTIVPYLTARPAQQLLDFIVAAFDGRDVMTVPLEDGSIMHGEVWVGDSAIMFSDGGPDYVSTPTSLCVYVKDCDAAYRQALSAGGTSLREPEDMPYGDRSAGVKDPVGNSWWLMQHLPAAEEEKRTQ